MPVQRGKTSDGMTIHIFTINKDKCIVYHVEKIQNTYFQFDRRFPNGNCCTHVHSESIFDNINVETVNIYVKEFRMIAGAVMRIKRLNE